MNTIGFANTSQPDFLCLTGLSLGCRSSLEWLARHTPRKYTACIFGNLRISRSLGISVRTLQRYLQEAVAAGLVEIVRDGALAVRRRIVLLWRKPADDALRVASSGMPEGPAPVAPGPEPAPSLPSPEPPREEETRRATPEEVAEVVAKAERVFHRPVKAEVLRTAREHRLSLVGQALDIAEKAGAYSWRFVEGVLRNWNGHPPQAKPSPVSVATTLDDAVASYVEWKRKREESVG